MADQRPIEEQVGTPGCLGCKALGDLYRKLDQRVKDLEDRLNANSSNSSKAPSSDPFTPRYHPKKPTGKRPGGQPGHRGFGRTLLPVGEVDRVIEHRPAVCPACRCPLSPGGMTLARRHQVTELPTRAVVITEHQAYACLCSCGCRTAAPIPPEAARSCIGPRLSAAVCYLSAHVHGSRRAVEDVLGELLGAPVSLGKVSNIEREMTGALAGAYGEIQKQVQIAPVKNVDETGWKRAGKWLWAAVTPVAALFRIDRGRNWHALQSLLGSKVQGIVTSDRCGLYNHLKTHRRGICWAHLKRDFQRLVDRGGTGKAPGEQGLRIIHDLFENWRRFKKGELDRTGLAEAMGSPRECFGQLLIRMTDSGKGKVRRLAMNLRRLEPALWTFVTEQGVEPTNNAAERALRPGVIWRKTSFGSHSQRGCRYAETMMTVLHTLRLKGQCVLNFLTDALTTHRLTPPPTANR